MEDKTMRGYKAATFPLSDKTKEILQKFSASRSLPSSLVLRSKIALLASEGKSNPQIMAATGAVYSTVSTWRNRFLNSTELIAQAEEYEEPDSRQKLEDVITSILSDKQRPGKEPVFTPQQILLINELACKNPKDFGYELSHWNLSALAKEAVCQGMVESISPASVQRFLKLAGIAPWKNRYWLHSPEKHENPDAFKKKLK